MTKCPRHRVHRVKVGSKGSTMCPVCHREASRAWNRAHPRSVERARARYRAKIAKAYRHG